MCVCVCEVVCHTGKQPMRLSVRIKDPLQADLRQAGGHDGHLQLHRMSLVPYRLQRCSSLHTQLRHYSAANNDA